MIDWIEESDTRYTISMSRRGRFLQIYKDDNSDAAVMLMALIQLIDRTKIRYVDITTKRPEKSQKDKRKFKLFKGGKADE